MNNLTLGVLSLTYLGLLFVLANWAERNENRFRKLVQSPYVYALSLAIYCTAWTYYGSVGRVAAGKMDFITVYLGPTFVMILGLGLIRKIVKIAKEQGINSIADFISTRYGKDRKIGILVTVISLLAGIPYISLQLKALVVSFNKLAGKGNEDINSNIYFVGFMLILFTILFGTRKIENNEKHAGIMFSIAFESVFKLLAFLAVGMYITYVSFDGILDILQKTNQANLNELFNIDQSVGTANWFWYILISSGAFLLLPRQFHVAVIENNQESHINKAIWLLPLYLLLINLFVIPLALGGDLLFAGHNMNKDFYVLEAPLASSHMPLALLAYLGGFSAATGMIIIETMAISTMMNNNLVLPLVLSNVHFRQNFTEQPIFYIKTLRRILIVCIILFSFIYFHGIAAEYSLVSIGMVSFVAVLQFAPALLGAIFWKRGHNKGAFWGMVIGFVIWVILLAAPITLSLLANYGFKEFLVLQNRWSACIQHISVPGLDEISNAAFWSLGLNLLVYHIFSLRFEQSPAEHNQAILFVNTFEYKQNSSGTAWRGKAYLIKIRELLTNFLGEQRQEEMLEQFARKNNLSLAGDFADPQIVSFTEKTLASLIGGNSARLLVASHTEEEPVSLNDVLEILKTSQQLMSTNKELQKKTNELQRMSEELQLINEKLIRTDKIKDDFLRTVTHELRTPLTSIRALSEIMVDNPDIDPEERKEFFETITREIERMGRLIDQVLDLERYESGRKVLQTESINPITLLDESIESMRAVFLELGIDVSKKLNGDGLMKADSDKLKQVILNLLSNAVKFVPKNGLGKIEIVGNLDQEGLKVSVQDNGSGIAEEYQKLIFRKFYQAEMDGVSKPKGTGLGLAISRKIIQLHGGKIGVDSQPGEGSLFYFSIPLIRQ